MSKNIKLLEERVLQAVGRLRELSIEREELKNELLTLRQQLDSFEQGGAADSDEREEDWQSQRANVVSVIRQTLAELRGN